MSRLFLIATLILAGHADGQSRVPPPLEAKSCDETAPPDMRPNDRFAMEGGRSTPARVRLQHGALTVDHLEQGRDLDRYEKLELLNPKRMTVIERPSDTTLARARTFLWEHWRDQKRAYLVLTMSSVDATSTSHVFVEQDGAGHWRVSWRIVRHNGEIDDLPTCYAVEWAAPAGREQPGKPIPHDVKPDPMRHELEFRDKCGGVEQSL